jgi:quinol-cytochrome oxidoreductase complex cytochrome b subunit
VIAALVVGALTFALVVPWARRTKAAQRTNRPAKAGIVCSILGLVTVLAFWSGLPIILGAGGAVLGRMGQERARQAGQRGLALSALALGIVAVVLDIALFLLGRFFAG